MKNILTVDFEDWHHGNYRSLKSRNIDKTQSILVKTTRRLLNLFKIYNCRATFFVLGEIAEKYPQLIKDIHSQGHEIASHGYQHELVYQRTKNEFYADVKKSRQILENICGEKIYGYRAPSWSVDQVKTPWFKEILALEGFLYDSSIFPFSTYLYGNKKAPYFIYKLNKRNSLLEVPPTIYKFCQRRIPFSGGFYFRVAPYFLIKYFTKSINNLAKPV